MTHFKQNTGRRSAYHTLKTPFPDVMAFHAVVKSLIFTNPLGCTSYWKAKKNHPPVQKVRERYTTKFVYENASGKRIGNGLDMYTSLDGYQYGIAAVITNVANTQAHGRKVRHIPALDLFSVTLKCHDPDGELFFISISRNRVTLSSYEDDAILARVEKWTKGVPALA
jgi:hypothetical protein